MPVYSEELQEQLARIDSLQQQIDTLRPLPPDVQARIFQKFRLDWNYHSNSIEGNSLTYGETVAFIMEGVTAKGKPLKDHLDLRGHNQAIDVLQDMIRNPDAELTERDIRELHSIIMAEPYEVTVETSAGPQRRLIEPGQYKTMPNHTLTSTGETHYYATPEETPGKMHDLIEWYRTHRTTLHPLVLAAQFHHRFVAIHPFDDGNGRMTRLLTNMLLMKAGYPPIVVKTEEKREYYAVLSQADAGVEAPLLEYFAERLIRSLDIYLKGARGEDINEQDDLDKEIFLFKKSFNQETLARTNVSNDLIIKITQDSFYFIQQQAARKLSAIHELFLDVYDSCVLSYTIDVINDTEENIHEYVEYNYILKNPDSITEYIAEKDQLEPGSEVVFHLNMHYFKPSNSDKHIKAELKIVFQYNKYEIFSFGKSVFSKAYPLQMSLFEKNTVIETFVRDTLRIIKTFSE